MTSLPEPGDVGSAKALHYIGSPAEAHPAWPMISCLPVSMAVTIPLKGLTIRKLLELQSGRIVVSSLPSTEDVPVKVGVLQVASGEFEVVEDRIALRLTRLA